MSWSSHVGAAFALGFALGAAPGPVQLLILTETAKRGFSGGVRVMLGANGTLFLAVDELRRVRREAGDPEAAAPHQPGGHRHRFRGTGSTGCVTRF